MANTSTPINFPNDADSMSKKKGKEWNLQFQRAIWSSSQSYGCLTDDWINRILSLRVQGQGNPDIDKFKNILANDGNSAFMNLAWDVSTPIPTVVENIVGQYINQGFKVDLFALNPESKTEYDKKKREMQLNKFLASKSEEIKELTGKAPKVNEKEVFESEEEMELHLELNWKQDECISMEQGISFVHNANDEKEIKSLMIRDLVEINIAAKRVYFDETLSIRERYVDPLRLLTSYSRKDDFSDIKYAGEEIFFTIDDLASMTKFTEEELADIAQSNASKNGNGAWNRDWEKRYYPDNSSSQRPYGDFQVRILDAEYYSYDTLQYEKIPAKKGNGYYFQKVKDGKPKSSKNKIFSKRIKTVYHSKWVIGTDYIFDYGLKENMLREKIKGSYSTDTPLSFAIYMPNNRDMKCKSLVEKMIPYANEICIMQLKAQQLIAKMRPNGVAVDVASIAGAIAGLGEKGFTPRDLQLLYEQTGNYYYSSMTEDGRMIPNQTPIRELPESLMQGLSQIINMTNHYLQQLELVTGVPLSTIGSPDKDALVGIEKMKTINRNNSIRFIEKAYKNILGRTSKMVALMIQDALKLEKGVNDFDMAIGSASTDVIKLAEKIHLTEYGIFINVLPDAAEQSKLEQQILQALQAGTIKQSDAMKVTRIGKESIELAERYMDLYERKYSKERQELAATSSQAQAQAQAESAALIEQAKQQTIALEWDRKDNHLMLEYKLKANQSLQDHEEEMDKVEEQGEQKIEQIKTAMQNAQVGKGDKGEAIAGSIPKAAGIRQPKVPQPIV